MNFGDWYTDTVDIWRVQEATTGSLTKHTRELVTQGVPCRIYRNTDRQDNFTQTAADGGMVFKIACDNAVDIRMGDELIVHRGGGLGQATGDIRAFASDPTQYFEPFGAVIPGLAHQEVYLLQQERIP